MIKYTLNIINKGYYQTDHAMFNVPKQLNTERKCYYFAFDLLSTKKVKQRIKFQIRFVKGSELFEIGSIHLQLFIHIIKEQDQQQHKTAKANKVSRDYFSSLTNKNFYSLLIIMGSIKNMNLQLEYCPLELENADELLEVTVEANRDSYPLWKHKIVTEEWFRESTRSSIKFFFEMQEKYRKILNKPLRCAAGMRLNGKLVAVGMSIDLVEQLQIFNRIAEDKTHPLQYLGILFKTLDFKDLKPGYAVYHNRWSVLPGLHKQGIAVRFAYEGSKANLSRGYQYSYSFTVVDNSFQIITNKMGAEVVTSTEYVGDGFKWKVNLLKLDLKKFVESYEKIVKRSQPARL